MCLYEAHIQNGFVCKALIIEIFEKLKFMIFFAGWSEWVCLHDNK
jgi:hypothetical protein